MIILYREQLNIKDKKSKLNIFQEFLSICKNLTDEQVKIAFDKFDTSGDDMLDYREFCEMINKREQERQ